MSVRTAARALATQPPPNVLVLSVVVCLLGPAAVLAQDVPLYPKLGLNVGVSYERSILDPNVPRDLKNHENHPDDAPFLFGSPGTTDLDRIEIDALRLQIGLAYRLGFRNLVFVVDYAPQFPMRSSGRLEKPQENDFRPPSMGSFIYTKLKAVSHAHTVATGLGFAVSLSEGQDWWLETQGLLAVGKWDITLEKGWSRFGRDQAALTSEASGFDLSPQVIVTLRTSTFAIDVAATYRQIGLSHQSQTLEDHTAQGVSLRLGGRMAVRLKED